MGLAGEYLHQVLSLGVILSVSVCCLALTWAWKAVNWVWVRPKRLERHLRKQGLRGNSYRFLIGDMKESSLMDQEAHSKPLKLSDDIVPRVMPFFHHIVKKYGKNCFTWYGPYPNVIIMEPESLREVLTKYNVFQKPQLGSRADVFVSGLVKYEGEKWHRHRCLMAPAYRHEKLKLLLPALRSSCEGMLCEWEVLASSTEGSVELDMWEYCHNVACDMLARAVFSSGHEDGKKIFRIQQEQVTLGLQAMRSLYIPGSRFLPTKFNKTIEKNERDMRESFKAIIERRKGKLGLGDDQNDLLGSLLAANNRLTQEQGKGYGLTLDDIIDECKAFYLAGENVTSVLMLWTMVMLGQHKDWQDRAREEVFQVLGTKEPDFDGLNHLKVVTMILHEVLRMYSPAPLTYRTYHQETKVGKLTLPIGAIMTIPILLVHHDPDLWGEDVNEFKPERFAHGVAEATKGRLAYFPFSTGPRTCIGQNFAMLEAKLFVAMVLRRFRLELSPSYTHAPFPSATTVPQHGAHMILCRI